MGSGASASLQSIAQRQISKDQLPAELSWVEFEGTKSIADIILEVENKTDFFFSNGSSDIKLVGKINAALRKKKVRTWFDEKKDISKGVENARLVLVFINKEYIDKVKGKDPNDPCLVGFMHAAATKSATNMIAIITDASVKDSKTWEGEVGSIMSKSELQFDFSAGNDSNFDSLFDNLYTQIIGKLRGAPIEMELQKINWADKVKSFGGGGGGGSVAAASGGGSLSSKEKRTGNSIDTEMRYLNETEKFLVDQLAALDRNVEKIPSIKEINDHFDAVADMLLKQKAAAMDQRKTDENTAIEIKRTIKSKHDEVVSFQTNITTTDMRALREFTRATDVRSTEFKEKYQYDPRTLKTQGFTYNDLMPKLNDEFFLRFGSGGNKGNAVGMFDKPHGVCLAGDLLLVTDSGNNRIQVFNSASGSHIKMFGARGFGNGQLSTPESSCIGPNSLIYVVDTGNHRIQIFNYETGEFIKSIGAGSKGNAQGQLDNPKGICIGTVEGGNLVLYVADTGNHRVQVFNADTGEFVQMFGTGSKGIQVGRLDSPYGVCIGMHGVTGEPLLYVSEAGNNRVQVFNANTSEHVRMFGTGTAGSAVGQLNQPKGICIGAGSTGETMLFVSDYSNHRVQVFNDKTGDHAMTFGTGTLGSEVKQLNYPAGVAVYGDNLFATAYHRVQVFSISSGAAVMYKR